MFDGLEPVILTRLSGGEAKSESAGEALDLGGLDLFRACSEAVHGVEVEGVGGAEGAFASATSAFTRPLTGEKASEMGVG